MVSLKVGIPKSIAFVNRKSSEADFPFDNFPVKTYYPDSMKPGGASSGTERAAHNDDVGTLNGLPLGGHELLFRA